MKGKAIARQGFCDVYQETNATALKDTICRKRPACVGIEIKSKFVLLGNLRDLTCGVARQRILGHFVAGNSDLRKSPSLICARLRCSSAMSLAGRA